jgi:excisionase family DNA binding protein
MSEAITLKEAAELVGVSVKTLRRAISSGKLIASKVDTKRGTAYTVDKDIVQSLYSGHSKPMMASNPMDGVTAELKALREIIEGQSKTIAGQTERMQSLEDELHSTKGALTQALEQVQKALPAPKRGWWPFGKR